MRRQVKCVAKDEAPSSFVYSLSCGHSVIGDLRRKLGGKRVQPKTAVCETCPKSAQPAPAFVASSRCP